jgi:hypothetical protein
MAQCLGFQRRHRGRRKGNWIPEEDSKLKGGRIFVPCTTNVEKSIASEYSRKTVELRSRSASSLVRSMVRLVFIKICD